MIPLLEYGLGFLVYIGFCMVTFKIYSKKEGTTQWFYLLMIYIYYTLLAAYVISFVDSKSGSFVIFIESVIYAIAGGFVLLEYYNGPIKKADEELYGQNV